MSDEVREIKAKVEIAYGNEEIADALKYESNDRNDVTCYENLFNNKHVPKVKAFTLEGKSVEKSPEEGESVEESSEHALSAGRGLIDTELSGWWSTEFSSEEGDDNVYPFKKPPTITIDLGRERPMKLFQIYGDPELNEYPTKFKICLFRENSETSCYEHEFTNGSVNADIDLTKAYDGELVNGYIVGITKMTVEILAWNKPHRLSKIYRCYDDIIERYEQDELKSFECIRELPNTDEIKYGLVSGSCSVTLLNNKGRKFDLGYLKDLAHINKRVVPYIGAEKLGSFYIKEWDISQDSMFVKCEASDRLLDFQDLMYEGLMPHEGEKRTFGELFAAVLDSANKHFVKKFEFDIDETLEQNSIEPYLPRKSVWDVLQMLCDASMSFVYIDKNDVICVRSELVERQSAASEAVVNVDNAFSINIPFFADMETNKVDISYYRKVVKPDAELYRISDYEAIKGENTVIVEFDKFCEIERIKYSEQDYTHGQFDLKKLDGSDFKYNISFTVEKLDDKSKDLIVYGKETTFEKQSFKAKDDESDVKNEPSLYTHPDCELIQSRELAGKIAERIKALYPSGTRSVTASWRGTEKLNLLETGKVSGRFGGEHGYMVTQIKNSVDGGFRQEIKGIKLNSASVR